MSRRDALRDLQGRLAERLQLARSEPARPSWLALECAGCGLLVPLALAGEIFPLAGVLPVPHTQPWFLGVTNLRGALHGVVDLAAFLGLRPALAADGVREQARLVALNPVLGTQCALLVDRLAGLRSAPQLTPQTVDGPPRPAFAAQVFTDGDGRAWQELDLAALARHEQFLAIAA